MGPTGIFGGTFDPVHHGHLRTALELLERVSLAQVVFIPSPRQPLRAPPVAGIDARIEMVRAALRGEPRFVVDTRELRRDGPSYTVDTLASLRAEQPRRPLCLLLGMDAFLSLPRWRRWEELTALANLVVAHRPGWQPPRQGALADLLQRAGTDRVEDVRRHRSGSVLVTPVTQLDVSASRIREFVTAGRDPGYLVPDSVRDVIRARACYAG